MAIPGKLTINIGLQNEAAGSDSLYTAFNKTVNNFTNLFACSSSFTSFTGNTGISVTYGNSNTGVDITNTGVTSLVAGTGIVLSGNTGAVTISSTGGGGGSGGTVTSIGIISSTLNIASSPIISAGNISINLPTQGSVAGTYNNPTVTIDAYGRVTSASNNTISGTVTSVGITPGIGIQVTNSPITTSGNITITNTGVTKLTQGTGIALSGSNGEITISTTNAGTVTSVNITSSTLTVTGGPISTLGTIDIELPNTISLSGNITAGNISTPGLITATGNITGANLSTAGNISGANVSLTGIILASSSENLTNGSAANLNVIASYFTTSGPSTATLAVGSSGQIKTFMMVADGGDMVVTVANAGWQTSGTGTITFNDIGDGCTLQYTNNKWFCIGQNGVTFA